MFPATVVNAARRPWARARPITKSTLGPGMTIKRNDMAEKARRRSVDNIRIMKARRPVVLQAFRAHGRKATGKGAGSGECRRVWRGA
ncbi:hypothetical protein GCM10009864_48190 [Streptomyces lunalinharesii]|uniref:Uncharacterized protein n=1 Tax=Streptomyces lunalinharesii TaxID=333384 RepID=A0ABP6ETQ8_9ACTN